MAWVPAVAAILMPTLIVLAVTWKHTPDRARLTRNLALAFNIAALAWALLIAAVDGGPWAFLLASVTMLFAFLVMHDLTLRTIEKPGADPPGSRP